MKKILTGLVGAALLTAAGAASATTWDFTQMAAGPYTSPYSFGTTPAGGPTLQTWGFDQTGASEGLWIKHEGTGETGLGLHNDGDHEIGPANAYIAMLMPTAQAGTTARTSAQTARTGAGVCRSCPRPGMCAPSGRERVGGAVPGAARGAEGTVPGPVLVLHLLLRCARAPRARARTDREGEGQRRARGGRGIRAGKP